MSVSQITTSQVALDQSKVVSQKTQVSGIRAFVQFCQSIADSEKPTPYWVKNLANFDRVFRKNQENFSKPIKEFIKAHRVTLEDPIISGTDSNDEWLHIPEGKTIPTPKPLIVARPRGIILPVRSKAEDEHVHAIPLSEVYSHCLNIKTDLGGVSAETIPAKFFELLYVMLLEAEPENKFFQDNLESARDAIMPVKTPVDGIKDAIGSFETMIPQLKGMVETAMGSMNDGDRDALDRAMKGDFSGVMSRVGPLLGALTQGMKAPEPHVALIEDSSKDTSGASDQE